MQPPPGRNRTLMNWSLLREFGNSSYWKHISKVVPADECPDAIEWPIDGAILQSHDENRRRHAVWPPRIWVPAGVLDCDWSGCRCAVRLFERLPEIRALENYRPNVVTELYADDGQSIGTFAMQRRILFTYRQIPNFLRDAILTTEDQHFEEHWGVDFPRVLQAAWHDVARQAHDGGREHAYNATCRRPFPQPLRPELSPQDRRKRFWPRRSSATIRKNRSSRCTAIRSISAPAHMGSRPPRNIISASPRAVDASSGGDACRDHPGADLFSDYASGAGVRAAKPGSLPDGSMTVRSRRRKQPRRSAAARLACFVVAKQSCALLRRRHPAIPGAHIRNSCRTRARPARIHDTERAMQKAASKRCATACTHMTGGTAGAETSRTSCGIIWARRKNIRTKTGAAQSKGRLRSRDW